MSFEEWLTEHCKRYNERHFSLDLKEAFKAGQKNAAQEILLMCMGNLHDCYGIDVAHEIRERFLAS